MKKWSNIILGATLLYVGIIDFYNTNKLTVQITSIYSILSIITAILGILLIVKAIKQFQNKPSNTALNTATNASAFLFILIGFFVIVIPVILLLVFFRG